MGALWAAGWKTSPDGAEALSGLCVWLLEGSEMSLQRFFGYVLRARVLNLQFSKTAFFNEIQPSELHMHQISFFTVLIYTIEEQSALWVAGKKTLKTKNVKCNSRNSKVRM